MKSLLKIIFIIILNVVICLGLVYYYFNSDYEIIKDSHIFTDGIEVNDKTLIINSGTSINGNITVEDGDIIILDNVDLKGNVNTKNGDLFINENSKVNGNVNIKNGKTHIGSGSVISGDLIIGYGELFKHSLSRINGKKPSIFVTYDRPAPLVYFDILPEKHKKSLGYIFLSKGGNINEDALNNTNSNYNSYYESVWKYSNGILIEIKDKSKLDGYFKKTKAFFKSVPQRKRVYWNQGATTKDFAIDKKLADIYIPNNGSEFVFIHEMGHVLDFKNDFIAGFNPIYPHGGVIYAINDYAKRHPGEDFAELYRNYVFNASYLSAYSGENIFLPKKYAYLKKYVFEGKEYLN